GKRVIPSPPYQYNYPSEPPGSRKHRAQDQSPRQPRIRRHEFVERIRYPSPERHESLVKQNPFHARMRKNKLLGLPHLLVHERRLAHLDVAPRLAILRDHPRIMRMLV